MEQSNDANKKQPNVPLEVEVKAGATYYWCACGKSSTPPFCDMKHNCHEFNPVAFTAEKDEIIKICDRFYICNCGQTKTPPYCDGTHKKLR